MSQDYASNYSFELRQRMQAIRNELPMDVQQAREEVNNLTDWKYYVRSYPQYVLPAVALAAYSLVPKSRSSSSNESRNLKPKSEKQHDRQVEEVQQTSILAGLTSAAVTLATRSAINMATKYGSEYLASRFQTNVNSVQSPQASRYAETGDDTNRQSSPFPQGASR